MSKAHNKVSDTLIIIMIITTKLNNNIKGKFRLGEKHWGKHSLHSTSGGKVIVIKRQIINNQNDITEYVNTKKTKHGEVDRAWESCMTTNCTMKHDMPRRCFAAHITTIVKNQEDRMLIGTILQAW